MSFSCYAVNQQDYLAELIIQADQQQLFRQAPWLKLLHYRKSGIYQHWVSEADDDKFFLAEQGKTNPAAELTATLKAFFSFTDDDSHAQCKFPARFHWLNNQLHFKAELMPSPACANYQRWRQQMNGYSVDLIFPSAFLNSPSSMFGHTFIRINPKEHNDDTQLLSYTVNYAADSATDENQFVLAYKGLFGGFKGITTLMPYHIKVKQYSDMESRDIWEYQLNFSPEETAQLIRHVWEIESINFDYFYLDENCAYRVIALLEVARPNLDILDAFSTYAIPADTIRGIVDADSLVDVIFRPSLVTQLKSYISQVNIAQQSYAEDLIYGNTSPAILLESTLSDTEKAATFELAYEVLRFKKQANELSPEVVQERNFPILQARSRIKQKSELRQPTTPEVRPDQGHKSARWQIQSGMIDDADYASLEWRSSFHELVDPPTGFTEGAQIEFVKMKVTQHEHGASKIDSLKFINIASISPRDAFFHPLSWEVSLGLRRTFVEESDPLVAYFIAGAGHSYRILSGTFYGLFNFELQADNDLENGFGIAPGAHTGWLSYNQYGQTMLELKYQDFVVGEQYQYGEFSAQHTFNLNQNQAISLKVAREKVDDDLRSNLALAFNYFY